jgi:hypothetical protein
MKHVLMPIGDEAGSASAKHRRARSSRTHHAQHWLSITTFAVALQACGPAQTADRVNADVIPASDGGSGGSGGSQFPTPGYDASLTPETGNNTGGAGGANPGMMGPPEMPAKPDAAGEVVVDMAPRVDAPVDRPVVVDMAPVIEVAPVVDMAMPQPMVMAMAEAPPAVTNLSTNGMLDWVHVGLGNGTTINRKRGITALITVDYFTSDFHSRYNDRPVAFTWNDGMPTMSQTETRDGSNIGPDAQSGFGITVPGNVTKLRTLTVYVGAWNATPELTVAWTGTGAPTGTVYMDRPFSAGAPGRDRMYRIRFQPARAEHRLRVQWRLQSVSDTYGNVTMQAVTLTE